MVNHVLRLIGAALIIIAVFADAPSSFAADRPAYKLGTGDKLKVTVFDEDELSGEVEVNDQGAVALPLVGQVEAAGKTLAEIQSLITQKYSESFLVNPKISINILNYRPFFILGEVKNPASYPYQSGMTVINAIALAGGYTPRASKGGISILHSGESPNTEQDAGEDAIVLPGDVITVPERFF